MAVDTPLHDERRELLERLLSASGEVRLAGPACIPRRGPGLVVPLSAEQRHVWLHASVAPQACLYNEAVTIHRRGDLDLAVLQRCLDQLLRRHEIWRTAYRMGDGGVEAQVEDRASVPMRVVDLSAMTPPESEQEALRLATEDARQPFDLARAPLLRALVVRLTPGSHRLYLALHHLIFDGVALYRVIVPELAALYAAEAAGRPHGLPEPRLQYGDYALWRESEGERAAIERALAYWRRKLSGELPDLVLPSDRPPPARGTGRGAMMVFSLPADLSRRLKALARTERVTLYALLLSAFKSMLYRYTGQEDLLIGGVTDMRRRPELADTVGYFLNGMALRTAPRPDKPFRAYLAEAQATVAEAIDACAAPLDHVVQDIRPARDGARHPLFQVLFSIQPPQPVLPLGWRLSQMDVCVGAAKFDLYLELEDQTDRIDGRFLYSTDMFDAATIERMAGHWQILLGGIADDPSQRLSALPLLGEGEAELWRSINATARVLPPMTVPGWFHAQAAATPGAVAVESRGESWTYAELARRVDTLAAGLRAAGAGPGKLVAVAMPRSVRMVASLLAILQSGAAYLPVDPDLPSARRRLLLDDARPDVLLREEEGSGDGEGLTYEATVALGAVSGRAFVEPAREDLAYVLYTSGSTGKPKAVEIQHGALANLLEAVRGELGIAAGDSWLAVTTLSFDIAALELFLPLVSGARLVVAMHDEATDPGRLRHLMEACDCTVMQATPAMWRALVATGWPGEKPLRVLCGGEALQADLAAELLVRTTELWNMYGPTETTIWSLCHRVAPGDDPVPIGQPLANTRIFVVDAQDNLLPVGVTGELLIAGEGLARGYRGDAVLTARKFGRIASLGGEHVYRTGDRARLRSDGRVEFVGRLDNQVKIRGFRVGLEEVEAALMAHPDVRAAAAAAVPDVSGESSLVDFVCGEALCEEEAWRIREVARERLPAYMVPGRVLIVPSLPLSPSGKVDRRRLPQPLPAPDTARAAPRDEVERQVCAVWQEVLQLPALGIHDNFFDHGGHSLLALVAMTRLSAIVGRELPLAVLLSAPTVAELARVLRMQRTAAFSHLVPLKPGPGRPLFIVHGIFGNVLQLKALADSMTTDRAIYGVQARGADPARQPHGTIGEMVDAYLAAIRAVQSAGPYALAGYSFGALVAYDMARRLRAAGEKVEVLALLEPDVHARYLPLPDRLGWGCAIVRRVARNFVALPWPDKHTYFRAKLRQLGHRLLVRLGLRDHPVALEGIDTAPPERLHRMYQIGIHAFARFRPLPYDGEVSLFKVTGERFDACDCIPIWRRAARRLVVHAISGEHSTIMNAPHVRLLAERLDSCLQCRAHESDANDG